MGQYINGRIISDKMADNEAKAIQLVADAEKKLGSSKGVNNKQDRKAGVGGG